MWGGGGGGGIGRTHGTVLHYYFMLYNCGLISLHLSLECPDPPPPVTGKFMPGAIVHFTLQSMVQTNHKFFQWGGGVWAFEE